MPRNRIAPQRAFVQWAVTLLLLALPCIRLGGESLLRLDAASRTLLFFGASIRIEEFYLFLIVVLIIVFGFLFVTMLFGRVWCGWFCPQTTISDLAEFIECKVDRLITSRFIALGLKQLSYILISFIFAANLIWYFIQPHQFFSRLVRGEIGTVAGITLLVVFIIVYLDLLLVRRIFCKTVCPYGRIQLLTMDRNTLTLEFDPLLKSSCIHCGACERICPMGIDIKDGLQIECINCGRCLDACRGVMSRISKDGLIHYTFGSKADGGGRPLNRKSLLLGAVIILLTALLAYGVISRKEATIKVQRAANGEVRLLPEGAVINFYTVFIENRSTAPATFSISVVPVAGFRVELIGPVKNISVLANANRKVDMVIKVSPVPSSRVELELQLLKGEKTVAVAPVPLLIK
ncbi:MAG: 4Fe-4S dicluster domain-containing protein [Desulfuromonadales bacterium]